MKRERFKGLVEEAWAALPARFRARVENVAIVVEDEAPEEKVVHEDGTEGWARDEELMGVFEGVPITEQSVWGATGPNRVVLYQKNIEAFAREAAEEEGKRVEDVIREEVRLTLLHELGHYFGMSEEQLEDV